VARRTGRVDFIRRGDESERLSLIRDFVQDEVDTRMGVWGGMEPRRHEGHEEGGEDLDPGNSEGFLPFVLVFLVPSWFSPSFRFWAEWFDP
jgi:hypothetical protein